MLSREDILSKKDLKTETVSLPDWGGEVIVTEMTAEGRDEWEKTLLEEKDNKRQVVNSRAKLFVATVVDKDGNRLFNSSDISKISKLPVSSVERVCRVAQRINGLMDTDLDTAKGNSEAAQSGDSTSA
jgi:hypothetical protein